MNLPSLQAARVSSGDLLAGLLRVLARTRPDADTRLIKNAYEVAEHCHQGQIRISGHPYITHPVAVAAILAETGADDQTLCAALLHDVVEDTPYTLAALSGEFGAEIAGLVDGIRALDAIARDQMDAAGNGRTPTAVMPGDERVLVIRLADRLHNMRTLRHIPRAKQVQKSRQTLDVHVPLARTLRMDTIRSELEDLASATLRRYGQGSRTASGRLLAATAALLPASARDRWREEWLGELHVLRSRRERVTFAVQVVLGVGRMAVALYQPAAGLMRACSAVFAAAATASGLIMGGWRAAVAVAATVLALLATLMWILRSDDRTERLARLICAVRNTPPRAR